MTKISAGYCALPSKTIHYLRDGTGRDGYISVNCGGLMMANELKTAFAIGKSEYEHRDVYK